MSRTFADSFACVVLGCVCLVSGCASRGGILGVDCCADIPAGAIPAPAGSKVCNWQNVQVAGAYADQSVLYRSDFVGDTAELSLGAIQRMSRLANAGYAGNLPWVIEPSDASELDQARVQTVINQLTQLGASPADVSISVPAAIGLSGPQAEQLGVGIGRNRNAGSGFSNRRGIGRRNFGTFGAGSIIR